MCAYSLNVVFLLNRRLTEFDYDASELEMIDLFKKPASPDLFGSFKSRITSLSGLSRTNPAFTFWL